MSEQKLHNGELFDAAATAESESVQWATLQLRRTTRAIRPGRPEALLQDIFVSRFLRYHASRRRFRNGIIGGSGLGGLAIGTDALFDIKWVELLNNMLDWFGRSLILRLAEITPPYLDWLC